MAVALSFVGKYEAFAENMSASDFIGSDVMRAEGTTLIGGNSRIMVIGCICVNWCDRRLIEILQGLIITRFTDSD